MRSYGGYVLCASDGDGLGLASFSAWFLLVIAAALGVLMVAAAILRVPCQLTAADMYAYIQRKACVADGVRRVGTSVVSLLACLLRVLARACLRACDR